MKKILFLSLFIGFFFSAQAGYIIRGVFTTVFPEDFKNYTLTVDNNGNLVSAGSMYHTSGSGTSGKNAIAIVEPNNSDITYFPIVLPNNPDYLDIEVRDFHYADGKYVLCGFRKTEDNLRAFVAVIDGALSNMWYNEYPEADIFYSICIPNIPSGDYYVCGKGNNRGVIASIARNNLHFTNYYTTNVDWEYHKIIAKYGYSLIPTLVVSGRDPGYNRIGFTTFDWQFNNRNSYMWAQRTEPASLCVVCDYVTEYNKIVLASSYGQSVTLNPVTFPVFPLTIDTYTFPILNQASIRYCVQDINMFTVNDVYNPSISVAGYMTDLNAGPFQIQAWHGYVLGLSANSIMFNNNYTRPNERFEHYKMRYDQHGNEYTGGYYEVGNVKCALFGAPLRIEGNCDNLYSWPVVTASLQCSTFTLSQGDYGTNTPIPSSQNSYPTYYYGCAPFRENEAPELVMPPHNENEIIYFFDRITVKDTPENTKYQIFTITGQLIQSGATNPDISTAQLSKGIYILRLENGKVFKLVK